MNEMTKDFWDMIKEMWFILAIWVVATTGLFLAGYFILISIIDRVIGA